ncbi:MAG: glycosyltransferase family 4 protein, partial [Limisphaerales bacterium]
MKLALIRRAGSRYGGAELYTGRLLAALVEAGHEVHLFAEDWADLPAGVTWRRVVVTGPRHARPRRFAEAVLRQLDPGTFDCVFSLERTLRQDVYRAGDGVHAAWLSQRRHFASWWRRPWIGCGAFHREMLAIERRTFNPANTGHVIVNSEMVRGEIRAHFAFPEERIHLVRNGVLADRFRGGDRAGHRRRLGLGEAETLLLFVGSGWERKGLRFVLAAMRDPRLAAAGVTLLVLGKGRPPWPTCWCFRRSMSRRPTSCPRRCRWGGRGAGQGRRRADPPRTPS